MLGSLLNILKMNENLYYDIKWIGLSVRNEQYPCPYASAFAQRYVMAWHALIYHDPGCPGWWEGVPAYTCVWPTVPCPDFGSLSHRPLSLLRDPGLAE